ncbi:hypothetical protein DRQ50_07895 [bacterium]|nr:MAG: hypothetical protein DRQ50_07895 [bacterium]
MTPKIRVAMLAGALALALTPAHALTLDEAWQQVLAGHPALAASAADLEARQARVEQAGRGLNPELEFEVENFAGSGGFSSFDDADLTLLLSQTWERGGKADSRRALANAELEKGRTANELALLTLHTDLARSWVEVLAARRRVAQADTLTAVADRDRQAVARRVAAGAESRIASQRAHLGWAAARREGDRAREALHTARLRLGALWGDDQAAYDPVEGDLERLMVVPTWTEVLDRIPTSPVTRLTTAELAGARAAVELATSSGAVDLTTAAGLRRLSGTDDYAFVAAVGIPLAVRNTNRDAQRAAAADVVRFDADVRAAEVSLKAELADAWGRLSSSRADAVSIRRDMLPAAGAALDEARTAYSRGAYSLTDVFAVRRTWVEWQLAHVEALTLHHLAAVDLAALLGNDITEISLEDRP